MGIRIHKRLGWGLTDIKTKNDDICDSRINEKNLHMINEDDIKFTDESLLKFAKKEYYASKKEIYEYALIIKNLEFKENNVEDFKRAIFYDGEYCLKNVLCISLPSRKSHYRYDDFIDYYESSSMKNSVKLIEGTYIYPYASFIDKRDGKVFKDHEIFNLFRLFNSSKKKEWKDKIKEINIKHSNEVCRVLEILGLKSSNEFYENVNSYVPDEIQLICNYFEIFKDKNTVYSLKPMIYTYWC